MLEINKQITSDITCHDRPTLIGHVEREHQKMYDISNPINCLDDDVESQPKFNFTYKGSPMQLTKTEHIAEIHGLWLNGPQFARYEWHDRVGPLLWRSYVRKGWGQVKFKSDFRILAAMCGPKHPADIILQDLWTFMEKDITQATKRLYGMQIKSVYRSMRLLGIVPSDFAPDAELEKIKKTRHDPRPITADHFHLMMTKSITPYRDWFALGCMAGMRAFEIAKLQGNWLERKYDGSYNLRIEGKGGHVLVVPACDYLVQMIQSYNTQGRLWAITGTYLSQLANDEMENLGIKPKGRSKISFHSTRHYFATTFLQASNKDWDATRVVMRHNDIKTTQGYAAVVANDNHVIVNKAFNQYKFSG